jgi:hypothetical protein
MSIDSLLTNERAPIHTKYCNVIRDHRVSPAPVIRYGARNQ